MATYKLSVSSRQGRDDHTAAVPRPGRSQEEGPPAVEVGRREGKGEESRDQLAGDSYPELVERPAREVACPPARAANGGGSLGPRNQPGVLLQPRAGARDLGGTEHAAEVAWGGRQDAERARVGVHFEGLRSGADDFVLRRA